MDDALLGELEELLYTADLGAAAVEVVAELQRRHVRGEIKGEEEIFWAFVLLGIGLFFLPVGFLLVANRARRGERAVRGERGVRG